MAYTSYKNKIYAGNAKRTGANPLITEGAAFGLVYPGTAVKVNGTQVTLAIDTSVGYTGQIADRALQTTDAKSVNDPHLDGDSIRVIDTVDADYVNVIVKVGEFIEKGKPLTVSDVPGEFAVATLSTDKVIFVADESYGVVENSNTLIRALRV
jgi:hypothetical protein